MFMRIRTSEGLAPKQDHFRHSNGLKSKQNCRVNSDLLARFGKQLFEVYPGSTIRTTMNRFRRFGLKIEFNKNVSFIFISRALKSRAWRRRSKQWSSHSLTHAFSHTYLYFFSVMFQKSELNWQWDPFILHRICRLQKFTDLIIILQQGDRKNGLHTSRKDENLGSSQLRDFEVVRQITRREEKRQDENCMYVWKRWQKSNFLRVVINVY